MKKSTELTFILTGIGLAALWALWGTSRKKDSIPIEPIDTENQAEEDGFIATTDRILPKVVHTPVILPKKVQSKRVLATPVRKIRTPKEQNTWLDHNYDTTQLTIHNTSDIERSVHLWSGNRKPPISPLLDGDVPEHLVQTISTSTAGDTGIYPQAVLVNPYNGYTYIANQLSHTITILSDGVVKKQIPLHAPNGGAGSPYGASPVDLTVNSLPNSPNYGKVYVAGILNNTVSILTTDLEVENSIPVGNRPIGITFNPVNAKVYVANIAEDTVSVLDTQTSTVVNTIAVGKAPRSMVVHPKTGEVYVWNSGDNSSTVIDTQDGITTIPDIGNGLTTGVYSPVKDQIYVVSSIDAMVYTIDTQTKTVVTKIPVGASPYRILRNPNTEFLYIGNQGENTFSVLDPASDTVRHTFSLGAVHTGIAIDPATNTIFSSTPFSATISVITYSAQTSAVTINEGYTEKQQDFIYNPARIEHVKFVLSGTQRFSVLQVVEQTINGTIDTHAISFSNYASPQNFANISEVTGLKGFLLNGRNGWVFSIAPKQTITILTYYQQIQRQRIIKNTI